jgi:thiamine kinase-like enzyme
MKTLLHEIELLPCFSVFDCLIEPINTGVSHSCFKVKCFESKCSENKGVQTPIIFFAKSLKNHTATAQTEVIVSSLASKHGLSADVIFSSSDWLVTQFIDEQVVTETSSSFIKKNSLSIALMAKLHQLSKPSAINALNLSNLLNLLISNPLFSLQKQKTLACLIRQVCQFPIGLSHVMCHGDLNFSNILLDRKNKAWLVDFESACLAEREFDLAMYVAINNIHSDKYAEIIFHYEQSSGKDINFKQFNRYLACCYLINGFWYLSEAKQESSHQMIQQKAKEQFLQFDQLLLVKQNVMELMANHCR